MLIPRSEDGVLGADVLGRRRVSDVERRAPQSGVELLGNPLVGVVRHEPREVGCTKPRGKLLVVVIGRSVEVEAFSLDEVGVDSDHLGALIDRWQLSSPDDLAGAAFASWSKARLGSEMPPKMLLFAESLTTFFVIPESRIHAVTGTTPRRTGGETSSVSLCSLRNRASGRLGGRWLPLRKPPLTRQKQNPRHVEARRGFLGPL